MAMIKKAAGKNDMSKRILVVDDQPDNRQIIRDMLARTDHEITEAENGELALAAIAKQRPDLILMDIQLPIMDGYTATSRIKSDPKLRSIPIIAVTSYALSGEDFEDGIPGQHYDWPARCSLHWRRGGSSRLHPVIPGSAARG
jgi:two-component system, cell cycle response regulator DivK